jgi:hypothetical protein
MSRWAPSLWRISQQEVPCVGWIAGNNPLPAEQNGLLQGSSGMQKVRPVYKGSVWHECRLIDILATESARSSTSIREDRGEDTPVVADGRREKCHPRDRRCGGYNEFDTIS